MTDAELWTIIVTALGSVATFSAVTVALYQTRLANKKKLKLTFLDNIKIASNDLEDFLHYVGISIVNLGNKNVIINNWQIQCKTERLLILTEFNKTPTDQMLSVKTPYKLEPQESITFYWEENKFIDTLKQKVEKHQLSEEDKIRFVVVDSTGQKYVTKSTEMVKKYIEKQPADTNIHKHTNKVFYCECGYQLSEGDVICPACGKPVHL